MPSLRDEECAHLAQKCG